MTISDSGDHILMSGQDMEVQVSRVAPFGEMSQLRSGSGRRRSHTQDNSYCDLSNEPVIQRSNSLSRPHSRTRNSAVFTSHPQDKTYISLSDSNLSCGVIPKELQSRLLDLKDYKSRTRAIEELKYLIQGCDFSSVSYSNMVGFISFLCTLLDDSNFTVVLVTLDVLNCFVLNLGQGVKEFLRPIVSSTVKLLGDGKITVKQEYMKIYMRLMKVAGPYTVLTVLLENLKHKNSRVREEVVNICIVSLLTYPSEDFNLPFLACEIAPCLIDSKRRVRHATLEAFAVLAASMGTGKSSLFKAVDEVELQENGDGLMNAVNARLARKTLPRITPQGLVEYALPFPSSAQTRGTHHLPGADTDWLLTGNRVQSGHYQAADHGGRGGVPHIDPVARRMLSAGKGKNKFPWESQDPGVLDVFPGTPTSEQTPFTFDLHHTPIVKTPTAKTRNSLHQAPPEYGVQPETLPAFSGKEEAPIPLKASMVRLPSGRKDLNNAKPVPPITKGVKSLPEIRSVSGSYVWSDAKPLDKACEEESLVLDLLDLSLRDEDDLEEMESSLRNVRNSAARKRAKMSGSLSDLESPDSMKIDLNMDSPSSTSSPISCCYSESGVYSRESQHSPLSPTPQLKKMSDVTLVSKLRPSRVLSARNKDAVKKPDSLPLGTSVNDKPVTVIGQRMNYRNGTADVDENLSKEIALAFTRHPPKDLQRAAKPIKGITTSASNFQQHNNDHDLTGLSSEDSVAVIGKGVFETLPPTLQSHSLSSFSAQDDYSPVKQSFQPPTGVYGRAVQQNTSTLDNDVKVAIAKSARDKMRQKREHSLKELMDVKDPVRRERLSHTDPGPVARESWRSRPDCLENVDSRPPALKRTSSLKKSLAQRSPYRDRSSVSCSSDIDPSVPRELTRPDLSITEVFKLLSDDDWEKKIEGLNLVRSLCLFHSDVVLEKLHELKIAVTQEVKNLRSSVSRAAIGCLGDMFAHLKKNMDHELDNCVRVLLHKAGETNTFIREDVDKALDAMAQNVTPARALAALINGGLGHLNTAVKKCAAQHMSDLVERMGPGWILSGIKDITDRAVPAIAKFAQDGSQETRFFGRKMLHYLRSHPEFDKMLEKYIPTKDLPYIRDVVKQIQVKGVGEIHETSSARGRRSYHGSVGSLRASSVSQNTHNTLDSVLHRDQRS
ncbi:TOG array regulator of axonemal microtubules protein 1 isoform X2 [Bufo bufo]|uniref:TOG array regulator of axonemal microtubules protein 1 isoform X2 n=1 Tax=Bufo bufo TaxID=8384 RepID=UPI001ABE77B8|nr:TOG array regulator of axonemal microtubules protein 1 isoform X2 [Bufo bufo]